ncbi:Histone-specific N-acetyltransferase NAT4 [Spathaspora sp. JA1]|nr:Histone-specific N-acetyltransferase NAT4 [Spathaspora sp. JA1]
MNFQFELDGEEFSEFNEEDFSLMETVAEDLCLNRITPIKLDKDIEFHCEPAHNTADEEIDRFIDVVDENLGDLYLRIKGVEWQDEKNDELTEPGLIYIWFTRDEELVGFECFKLCLDDDNVLVLYLYEIHLTKKYQRQSFGGKLITQFHNLAKKLRDSNHDLYKHLAGTALTVFTDNSVALNWYKGFGYELTSSSPQDKVLRDGKTIKPDYYLMRRTL